MRRHLHAPVLLEPCVSGQMSGLWDLLPRAGCRFGCGSHPTSCHGIMSPSLPPLSAVQGGTPLNITAADPARSCQQHLPSRQQASQVLLVAAFWREAKSGTDSCQREGLPHPCSQLGPCEIYLNSRQAAKDVAQGQPIPVAHPRASRPEGALRCRGPAASGPNRLRIKWLPE